MTEKGGPLGFGFLKRAPRYDPSARYVGHDFTDQQLAPLVASLQRLQSRIGRESEGTRNWPLDKLNNDRPSFYFQKGDQQEAIDLITGLEASMTKTLAEATNLKNALVALQPSPQPQV